MTRVPGPTQSGDDFRDGLPGRGSGDTTANLHVLLYGELRELARRMMNDQPPGQTLQATALVNEAYLKLAGAGQSGWVSREHYLRAAACAMRSVLVDRARWRRLRPVVALDTDEDTGLSALDRIVIEHEDRAVDLIELDRALEKLALFDESMVRAIELRFFAGLELEAAAKVLGISERMLRRHWAAARAWLHKEMGGGT